MEQKTETLYGGPRGYGQGEALVRAYRAMIHPETSAEDRRKHALFIIGFGPEVMMLMEGKDVISAIITGALCFVTGPSVLYVRGGPDEFMKDE